jgi:glycosyltransferase involved in cell wall biosynthesis
MQVLFVHPNYPAQFGRLARELAQRHGVRCTCVSEKPGDRDGPVERLPYRVKGGATAATNYHSRTFENAVWHAEAVYDALAARPDLRPDLVVGHSGFGTTLFLRELYPRAAVLNYFEFFYHPSGGDMDFRPEFAARPPERLRARARNAMILLDLDNCDLGYSPTEYQRGLFPAEYQGRLRVIFDGIDTNLWRPRPGTPRRVGSLEVPAGMKVVSYATRGMESMRGFDVFMRAAKILADRRRDVLFVVAGQDRVCYGGDHRVTGGKSFKEWVMAQDDYDPARFAFVGLLPPEELARLFAFTDLHVYLTVPFVLSWSLVNALACGATVLASDTAPVREVIAHGRTGLLTDFFDAAALADTAGRVLDDPAAYRPLGESGAELVRRQYSLDVCVPQHLALYREVIAHAQLRHHEKS